MTNLVIVAVLLLIIGGAVFYIAKEKKRGVKCVGCPAGATCAHKNGASGCNCSSEKG